MQVRLFIKEQASLFPTCKKKEGIYLQQDFPAMGSTGEMKDKHGSGMQSMGRESCSHVAVGLCSSWGELGLDKGLGSSAWDVTEL